MARERISRNAPCPCGSGKKYKHCCYGKGLEWQQDEERNDFRSMPLSPEMADIQEQQRQKKQRPKFPIGTVVLYGPDDKTTTKTTTGVIRHEGAEPVLNRWVGIDVLTNRKVQREMREFFEQHGVQSVVMTEGNMGCPHEEGEDFPVGEDCPFCPFWKGKQGSNRQD